MFCSKCGAKAPDNARFCTVCGSSLYGAPILQIHKDAEGKETIQVISGASGIMEADERPEKEEKPVVFGSAPTIQESADQMFKDAEAMMTFGDYTLAANGFRKMSAAYPEDCRGWFGELRADILHHLGKGRYDPAFTYASAPEPELLSKTLSCNPDVSLYAGFFEEILPEWETKPHMYPLQLVEKYPHGFCDYAPEFSDPALDDRDVGAESLMRAARPQVQWYYVHAREGVYYNPDSFMCWFVKKGGIADMIRMLRIPALDQRAEGLRNLFETGYREGKLVGPNYCCLEELDREAYDFELAHRGDFNSLIRLIRGFGIDAKYYQMAQKLIVRLPGEREERKLTVLALTVIGRTTELVTEEEDGQVRLDTFVYPEGTDPKKFLKG